LWRQRRAGEQLQAFTFAAERLDAARLERLAAVPDQELRRDAVAVEVLAEAPQADEAVPEFLVRLDARGARAVLDLGVAPREQHFRQALVEEFGLLEERYLFGLQQGQRWGRRGEAAGDAAELARLKRGPHLFDPRHRRRDGRIGQLDARDDVAREYSRWRERRVERCQPAVDRQQRARQLGDGRAQRP
jgi:hypothetical protein